MTPTPTFADLLALADQWSACTYSYGAVLYSGDVPKAEQDAVAKALTDAREAFRTALAAAFATPGEDEVERVARALCMVDEDPPATPDDQIQCGWSDDVPVFTKRWQRFEAHARAAIAAMSPRPSAKDSGGDAPRPEPSSALSLAQGWQPIVAAAQEWRAARVAAIRANTNQGAESPSAWTRLANAEKALSDAVAALSQLDREAALRESQPTMPKTERDT